LQAVDEKAKQPSLTDVGMAVRQLRWALPVSSGDDCGGTGEETIASLKSHFRKK
jgi:hypothetical protein